MSRDHLHIVPPEGGDDQESVEDFELEMPEDVRYCYRHPRRETGVSCSNCGRPICHECMIPAAVGFRCPDCVAQQRKGGGRARVVTRSQTRARWQSSVMGAGALTVTKTLIGLNVAAYVLEVIVGKGQLGSIPQSAILRLGGLFAPDIVQHHQYWRLFTAMFLHVGLFHIGVNMLSLFFVGSAVEQLAGRGKYIAIYLISGLAGNVAVLALAPVGVLTVGASTAIFGIFGALLVYVFRNRSAFPSQVLGQLAFWMAFNLIYTFTHPSVSWQGHIGGLVGGIVTLELLTRFGRRPLHTPLDAGDVRALAIVLVALIAIVVWRAATFPVL